MTVSTSSTVFDINTLFVNAGDAYDDSAAVKAMTGRFTQLLAKTADYTLTLVMYVNNKGAQDEPENGSSYELTLTASDKTLKFDFPDKAIAYANAYTLSAHGMKKITFDLSGVSPDTYQFAKSGSSAAKLTFYGMQSDVVVVGLVEKDGLYTGFVKQPDVVRLPLSKLIVSVE